MRFIPGAPIPVDKAGRYRLDLYATQASDFGVFQSYLDDSAMNGFIDAFASTVRPSGRITLGTFDLRVGLHRLRILSTGKNALSSNYYFGVDRVELLDVTAPSIGIQPFSQTAVAGSNVKFTVVASGATPFSYQWQKDGSMIPQQTAATLWLTNINRASSGIYSVLVTNVGGSVGSSNAALRVLTPQRLDVSQTLADGRFQFVFGDHDGGPLVASNAVCFIVQGSTNLSSTNWTPLPSTFVFTNGHFRFVDENAPSHPRRFYRIVGQ